MCAPFGKFVSSVRRSAAAATVVAVLPHERDPVRFGKLRWLRGAGSINPTSDTHRHARSQSFACANARSNKHIHNTKKMPLSKKNSPASLVLVLLHDDIHSEEDDEDEDAGDGRPSSDGRRLKEHPLPRRQVRPVQVLELTPLTHVPVRTPVKKKSLSILVVHAM